MILPKMILPKVKKWSSQKWYSLYTGVGLRLSNSSDQCSSNGLLGQPVRPPGWWRWWSRPPGRWRCSSWWQVEGCWCWQSWWLMTLWKYWWLMTLHSQPLYPPGRIIHIVRHHPKKRWPFFWRWGGVGRWWYWSMTMYIGRKRGNAPVYQAVWADNRDFDQVSLLLIRHFFNHFWCHTSWGPFWRFRITQCTTFLLVDNSSSHGECFVRPTL